MTDWIITILFILSFFLFRYYRTWLRETREKHELQGLPFGIWEKFGGLIPGFAVLSLAIFLFFS